MRASLLRWYCIHPNPIRGNHNAEAGESMGWRTVGIMVAMVALAACGRSAVRSMDGVSPLVAGQLRFEERASVTLRLSPQDLRGAVDQEAEIWRRARHAAVFKMATDLLVRRMVAPLPATTATVPDVVASTQKGRLTAEREQTTGDFVQTFRGQLTLDLTAPAVGRVVGLETRGYMAGSQQRVYATLPARPVSLPAYVAIFKPHDGAGEGMYRLGAIGEVVQLMETMDRGRPVALGNVELLMADRETEEGDAAVLLTVAVEALEETTAAPAPPTEVTVTPQRIPTITEPKVKK